MSPRGRTRLRLALRDLSATAAFASIVLSGSVPAWALAAYALALITSLAGRRPLAARPTVSVVLLLLTGVVLFGAAIRGLMDLVVAACTFAGLVTSHRLLSEPTKGTDQQVQLTSLLMLAGGAALTGELWFGACLAAFAITSCLSLALSVIEPENGSEDHVDVGPVLGRVSAGTAFALGGAIVFFVLFPRLSWNIAARRQPPGLLGGTTGMSDSVRLGGAGDIKSNPRVVARVKLTPDRDTDTLDAYFAGRSFDVFDGKEWRGTGTVKRPRILINLRTQERRAYAVKQNIELLPGYGSRTLIAMEHPIAFNNVYAITANGTPRAQIVEVTNEEVRVETPGNSYTYTVTSSPEAKADALEDPARYDQLPEGLDSRIAQRAAEVLNGEKEPLAAAKLLQGWLQREYAYTLELEGSPADPLADFLFVRKAGHCEHFATALTVMLRTQHIPARVTAGFFGGERIGSSFVLRAGDAHAWTQVFVPGRGWVTVDATPESGRQNQPSRVLAWITAMYERLEDLWRARVVDYSFQDQIDIARSLVRPPEGATRSELPPLPGPAPIAVAACVAVAVYVLVQRLFRRPRPGDYRRHAASGFLDQIEARLHKAGIAKLPGEAIEELTQRLAEGAHPIAPALSKATRAYLSARFGGAKLSASDRDQLLAALR